VCECGRTTPRIAKLKGRSDDMLIISGVNVFPSQVETALLEIEGVSPHYQMIVDRVNNLDTLEVRVEVDENVFSDEIREMEALTKKISAALQSALLIAVKVKLVEPRSLDRFEGKSKRVIDKRVLVD
ncbi:MAG: phenylacetate--CoA ligase, partial [Lachnospiraceae bacterium]|nr:phenylacetate--CoA ligase [Lachnospiraceae bacterium]